jgi:radical SAM superfamily enzyme YgiQ (UPF0313 family)
MTKRLYLINPPSDFPTYYGGESFAAAGLDPACVMSDLATTTVASLASPYFQVRVCEANVEPIDYSADVDFVGITGKLTQVGHMLRIAREFRRRGRTIIIGGPFATLSPEAVRADCDILFRGELEGIADQFFSDLASGTWKADYDGGQPDISASPLPRWDLYPNNRAMLGTVQTSRGCPFECEFCDVIQYLGRKQRFKSVEQIVAELDQLHGYGYRRVFLSDDNFTVSRKRARSVLEAMRAWNDRHRDAPMMFKTQASIEVAEDEELLDLCVEAGLTSMFVGIETPNPDSLRETKKYQNLRKPILESIDKIISHGITIQGGMIVGFDSDGPDMFERMLEFAMHTPIPFFNLGALVAPPATPLLHRMRQEGRLIEGAADAAGLVLDTNIIPKQMTREELLRGVKWLGNQLYRPQAITRRLERFSAIYGTRRRSQPRSRINPEIHRSVYLDAMKVVKRLRRRGPEEDRMIRFAFASLTNDPDTNTAVMEALTMYAQVRHVYEQGRFWDDHLPEHYDPPVALSVSGGAAR